MKKIIYNLILSFFLLLSSNAYAVAGKKEARFLDQMQEQLVMNQEIALRKISTSSDKELKDEFGEAILQLVFNNSALLSETGISLDKSIRENSELLFSDQAVDFIYRNVEEKLSEAGSLKAFQKTVTKNEKKFKSMNKGLFKAIGKFLKTVTGIITMPFFFIFGPWGMLYWIAIFGAWE